MRYKDWEWKAFAGPEFDLAQLWQDFEQDADSVWYIDRHVFEVDLPVFSDLEIAAAGCRAGLALLRQWRRQRSTLGNREQLTFEPFLAIDDAWLLGADQAPPPHVYLCLARQVEQLRPVQWQTTPVAPDAGPTMLTQLLQDEVLEHAEGNEDDPSSVWIVRPSE